MSPGEELAEKGGLRGGRGGKEGGALRAPRLLLEGGRQLGQAMPPQNAAAGRQDASLQSTNVGVQDTPPQDAPVGCMTTRSGRPLKPADAGRGAPRAAPVCRNTDPAEGSQENPGCHPPGGLTVVTGEAAGRGRHTQTAELSPLPAGLLRTQRLCEATASCCPHGRVGQRPSAQLPPRPPHLHRARGAHVSTNSCLFLLLISLVLQGLS